MTTEAADAAKTERQPASFGYECKGPAYNGVPVVNGHRILNASRIDVHLDAKVPFPEVVMRLFIADAATLGFDPATIRMDDETRAALVSLGWTPPDDGKTCACGSRHPEGYECAIGPIPPETATAGEIAAAVPRRDGYRIA